MLVQRGGGSIIPTSSSPWAITWHMNLLLQLYTPSKCQIYNKWTVHEHKCLSSFLFFRFPSNWERERGYTKFGIRRNSPKGTYLISLMEFRGESVFFYGLIDFMLFLILAWRTWVPRVRVILLSSSTRNTGFGFFCPLRTLSNDWLSYSQFPLTGRSSHFRFRAPVNRLASTFPCQAIRVRSPSINICGSPLSDLHSFLTVTLWWLATVNSNAGNSINLISIVSVGYHVTIYI